MRLLIVGSGHYALMHPYVQEQGIETVLLCTYRYRDESNLALATKGYHLPKEDGPERILEIARSEAVDAALSISVPEDMNLRDAQASQLLRTVGIPMLAQPEEFITLCTNKAATKHYLRSRGFPVPQGWECASAAEVLAAVDNCGFPSVVKLTGKWGGQGLAVIDTTEQLATWLEQAEFPVLVEPFLDGIEFSVETLVCPSGTLAMPPIHKGHTSRLGLHAMDHFRIAPYPVEGLQELAADMAVALGSRGPADFDFVLTAEGPFLLEVNPRVGGVTRMTCAASGFNTFELLLDMALGKWEPCRRLKRPRVSVEIPVYVDALLHPGWVEQVKRCTGVADVMSFSGGACQGRVGLEGTEESIRAALDQVVATGIVSTDTPADFADFLKRAQQYAESGRLVYTRPS